MLPGPLLKLWVAKTEVLGTNLVKRTDSIVKKNISRKHVKFLMDYLFTCLLQIELIDTPRNDVSARTCYVSRQYFIHIAQYMELNEYDVEIKSNPI